MVTKGGTKWQAGESREWGDVSGEEVLWYLLGDSPLYLLLIRNNTIWLSSQRDQARLLKLQKFCCQKTCLKISQICHGRGIFFCTFVFFFLPQMVFIAGKAEVLQAQSGWEMLKTEKKRMWGGRFQTCPSSQRAGVAHYHFPLAQSTKLLCSPGACPEPEVPLLECAHQLSLLRQNSLVQRIAWEARAPSTIPSTIPTDWEALKKKKKIRFFPSIH